MTCPAAVSRSPRYTYRYSTFGLSGEVESGGNLSIPIYQLINLAIQFNSIQFNSIQSIPPPSLPSIPNSEREGDEENPKVRSLPPPKCITPPHSETYKRHPPPPSTIRNKPSPRPGPRSETRF